MTGADRFTPTIADRLEDLAAEAAALAREAEPALRELERDLPEGLRLGAGRLGRSIASATDTGRLFDDGLAADLGVFCDFVEDVIARGTTEEFVPEASEEFCGVGRGGWIERVLSPEARAIDLAFRPLRRLRSRIELLRDHAAGERGLMRLRRL